MPRFTLQIELDNPSDVASIATIAELMQTHFGDGDWGVCDIEDLPRTLAWLLEAIETIVVNWQHIADVQGWPEPSKMKQWRSVQVHAQDIASGLLPLLADSAI